MKKILSLFGAVTLVLVSCSHDDDSQNGENLMLPKSRETTNPQYPDENENYILNWDGNKLVSEISEGEQTNYTYEGNLIVKCVTYDFGDKEEEESYHYKDGKLSYTSFAHNFTAAYPFGEYRGKYVYTYNADGTVTKETYYTNAETGEDKLSPYKEVMTFQNGNIIKIVAGDTTSPSNSIRTSIYEYDSKNNVFKNALGYNLLLEVYNSNNEIRHTYSYANADGTVSNSKTYSNVRTYEYNAEGFPIKETYYNQDNTVSEITNYTY